MYRGIFIYLWLAFTHSIVIFLPTVQSITRKCRKPYETLLACTGETYSSTGKLVPQRERKKYKPPRRTPLPPTLQELAVILCFYSVASKCVVIKKLDSHDPSQILSNLQCFEFNFASSSYSSYGANTATYFETSACWCVPRKYVLQARSY